MESIISVYIQPIIMVVGWVVLYFLSINKLIISKRKDVKTDFLIQAWRLLENASNRIDDNYILEMERAIADVQLFGSKRQIELAMQFAEELSNTKKASAHELLLLLREDLRKELKLEKVPRKLKYLRITVDG